MRKKYVHIAGIDEAGRGPLAGPIALAIVAANYKLQIPNRKQIPNIQILKNIIDSKKLSPAKREMWYRKIKSQKSNLKSFYVSISHKTIDKIGIQKAALLGVERVLKKIKRKPDLVLMDGGLKAPQGYKQKTIIKGDERIPLISAASIIAKVSRDRKMLRLHKKFPKYRFDKHKGYGTKLHYKMLKKHKPCQFHRKSFLKNFYK